MIVSKRESIEEVVVVDRTVVGRERERERDEGVLWWMKRRRTVERGNVRLAWSVRCGEWELRLDSMDSRGVVYVFQIVNRPDPVENGAGYFGLVF